MSHRYLTGCFVTSKRSEDRAPLKKLLGKSGIAGGVKIANAGLSYLMSVLIARLCGAEDFGVYAILFSTCMTLSLISPFGQNTVVLRFYSEYETRRGLNAAGSVLKFSALLTLFGQIIAELILAYVVFFSDILGENIQSKPALFIAALILAFGLGWGEYVSAALRALGYVFKALAPRDVYWRVTICFGALFALYYGGTNNAYYTAQEATLFVSAALIPFSIAQTALLYRNIRGTPPYPLSCAEKKSIALSSFYVWGAAALQAVTAQAAIFAVSFHFKPAVAGGYFAADRTAFLLSLFQISICLVAMPMISEAYARREREKLQMILATVSFIAGGAALIGAIFLMIFGDEILRIFNPAYIHYQKILLIIALGQCVNAVTGPATSFLQIAGAEKPYFYACLACSVAVIAGYISLPPLYGLTATAWLSAGMLIAVKLFAWFYGYFKLGYDLTGVTFALKKIIKK